MHSCFPLCIEMQGKANASLLGCIRVPDECVGLLNIISTQNKRCDILKLVKGE